MIRPSYLVVLMLTLVALPRASHAAPTAYYHPPTGTIYLKNDINYQLYHIAVGSTSKSLKTDPSLYASVAGATFDPGDLPFGFTYLSFPPTGASPWGVLVGQVVKPGTPTADLWGNYLAGDTGGPMPTVSIVEVPEPSTGAIAVIAVAGVALIPLRRWQPARSKTN